MVKQLKLLYPRNAQYRYNNFKHCALLQLVSVLFIDFPTLVENSKFLYTRNTCITLSRVYNIKNHLLRSYAPKFNCVQILWSGHFANHAWNSTSEIYFKFKHCHIKPASISHFVLEFESNSTSHIVKLSVFQIDWGANFPEERLIQNHSVWLWLFHDLVMHSKTSLRLAKNSKSFWLILGS